jgi:hypothetical protein
VAALNALCASLILAPAFLAARWMLKTTKEASASQNSAMTATTQPTDVVLVGGEDHCHQEGGDQDQQARTADAEHGESAPARGG